MISNHAWRRVRAFLASAAVLGLTGFAPAKAALVADMDPGPSLRLITAIEAHASSLGLPVDASGAVRTAGLSSATATELATTLELLTACSRRADTSSVDRLRSCALQLDGAALRLGSRASGDAGSAALQVWPVVDYRPGAGNDVHRHDYALVVDGGGNDTYLNNAGGNLLDLVADPAVTSAAAGCQNLVPDSTSFRCMPSAALLVDDAGDDTYGRLETPGADAACTTEPVVRRIATGGAGVAGVGVLVDQAGNDRYTAKALALGTGHAGVGRLHDAAGNDTYAAARNSIGFGLIGGEGSVVDEGGNDRYGYWMPAGGLFNDDGVCDAEARALQGVGVAGGIGSLHDLAGNDTYIAPTAIDNCHLGPDAVTQVPGVCAGSGSQGFGSLGGRGALQDDGGRDRYVGMPARADDTTLAEGHPQTGSTGTFTDKNSRS
jgi:hypothetical protein